LLLYSYLYLNIFYAFLKSITLLKTSAIRSKYIPIIKWRAEKSLLFSYRKWNILAFRGRLMSLLVLTHCGVSSRPLGLRLLAPPKTFPLTGVSHIPFASIAIIYGLLYF